MATDQIPLAIPQITEFLRERHRIPEGRADDFEIHDVTAITETFSKTTSLVALLLGCVASISLVVGGVVRRFGKIPRIGICRPGHRRRGR